LHAERATQRAGRCGDALQEAAEDDWIGAAEAGSRSERVARAPADGLANRAGAE